MKNLAWEDIHYLTIEFLNDEDPFLNEKGGHNIGPLLTRIRQNVYNKYLESDLREDKRERIIPEPDS